MSRLEWLDALPVDQARAELLRCCGSQAWAHAMAEKRPFASEAALTTQADDVWWSLAPSDWLEAFAAHPRIGDTGEASGTDSGKAGRSDRGGGLERTEAADWSRQEQAGVADAAEATRNRLATANREYEARFGYIFIVCATGRTAATMLDLLERRLRNDPALELGVAAEEQRKIIRLRLAKLVGTEQVTTT